MSTTYIPTNATSSEYQIATRTSVWQEQNITLKTAYKIAWEVTQNPNFTWSLNVSLYVKVTSCTGQSGFAYNDTFKDMGVRIGNTCYYLSNNNQGNALVVGAWANNITDGQVTVNGTKLTSNPSEWTKFFEQNIIIQNSNTGRWATELIGIRTFDYHSSSTYFIGNEGDDIVIRLTLPSFSGMVWWDSNTTYKSVMPWIKVNGEWKPALQYIKVNGAWKKCSDTWIWT